MPLAADDPIVALAPTDSARRTDRGGAVARRRRCGLTWAVVLRSTVRRMTKPCGHDSRQGPDARNSGWSRVHIGVSNYYKAFGYGTRRSVRPCYARPEVRAGGTGMGPRATIRIGLSDRRPSNALPPACDVNNQVHDEYGRRGQVPPLEGLREGEKQRFSPAPVEDPPARATKFKSLRILASSNGSLPRCRRSSRPGVGRPLM